MLHVPASSYWPLCAGGVSRLGTRGVTVLPPARRKRRRRRRSAYARAPAQRQRRRVRRAGRLFRRSTEAPRARVRLATLYEDRGVQPCGASSAACLLFFSHHAAPIVFPPDDVPVNPHAPAGLIERWVAAEALPATRLVSTRHPLLLTRWANGCARLFVVRAAANAASRAAGAGGPPRRPTRRPPRCDAFTTPPLIA